jgi:hypothetical protein
MSDEMTIDDVRKRAQVAGLALREDRLESVRRLLQEALAPLRRLDSRTIGTLEPATTFDAAPGTSPKLLEERPGSPGATPSVGGLGGPVARPPMSDGAHDESR